MLINEITTSTPDVPTALSGSRIARCIDVFNVD
jgi:hypothetical protein